MRLCEIMPLEHSVCWLESSPAIAQQITRGEFRTHAELGYLDGSNKGGYLLSTLTLRRDPKLLYLIRSRASDSLVEMARWRNDGHAQTSRLILGRIAGIEKSNC
jgi:hypothetical protein